MLIALTLGQKNIFAIDLGIVVRSLDLISMSQNMTAKQFVALLRRFLNGKASPREHRSVSNWIDGFGEKKANTVSENEIEQVGERLWTKIQNQTLLDSRAKRNVRMQTWATMGIAASIAAILIVFVIYDPTPRDFTDAAVHPTSQSNDHSDVINADNAVKTVNLPDGSLVLLQPKARISFTMPSGSSQRVINLEGDAFFEVKRDTLRPFIVYAGSLTTTVLGTSFRIQSSGKNKFTKVWVESGKVAVASNIDSYQKPNQQVILIPNQQALFDPSTQLLTTSVVENPLILQKSEVRKIYHATPLIEILLNLEKAYGISIHFNRDIISSCKVTTAFSDETLYERLDILSKAIDASYSLDGTTIQFESNGCN